MTIEEFGKSVKAKYPQYKNLPDADLGQKVLEKYPVYKSKITGSSTKPLTQEQKEAKKAEIDSAITHDDQGVEVKKPDGFFDRLAGRFTKRAENVNEIMTRRGTEVQQGAGKLGTAGKALVEIVGQGGSFASDVLGEGMTSTFRSLPDAIEDPLRSAGRAVATSKPGQAGLAGLSTVVDKAAELEKQHPVAGGVARIGLSALELAGAGKAVGGAAKAAKSGVSSTVEAAKTATTAGKKFLKSTPDDLAVAGKKIMTKASDVVTPVEEGVETVLKTGDKAADTQRVMAKFDQYSEQAKKAVKDYSQATPLELAGKEAERALSEVQNIVKKTGAEKAATLKNRVYNPKRMVLEPLSDHGTGDIVDVARAGLRKDVRDLGVTFMRDGSVRRAPLREIKIANKADLKLLQDVDKKLASLGTNPSFQRVDDTVDYLQNLLYQRSATPLTVPVHGQLEGMIKRQIGELNSALKKIGGKEYTKLNADYSDFLEIRNVLNKGLGVDANKGASLMKQLFSPSGTMPRKLFADIKKLTGIDLVEDATLAKYVMERIGDVRQASLLEQVLKGGGSARGFLQTLVGRGLNKLQDPIGKAKRIMESEILKRRP